MLRTTSFSAAGQEQGIHQYIPPDLRRMFYKNPAAIHASHNGLDPYGFSTRGLVCYLPLWALQNNVSFQSVDAYKHACSVTGALWQPDSIWFDKINDKIDIGAGASLGLGNTFSIEAVINLDALTANCSIYSKGTNEFYFATASAELSYYGGASVLSDTALQASTWYHVIVTHAANDDVIFYLNGAADGAVSTADGEWASTDGFVGIFSDGTSEPFGGYIGELRLYNRVLSVGESLHNKNCVMWRYQ